MWDPLLTLLKFAGIILSGVAPLGGAFPCVGTGALPPPWIPPSFPPQGGIRPRSASSGAQRSKMARLASHCRIAGVKGLTTTEFRNYSRVGSVVQYGRTPVAQAVGNPGSIPG